MKSLTFTQGTRFTASIVFATALPLLLLLLLLSSATAPRAAEARPGNFERYPVGTESIGMGGTGVAAGQSVWHNPAGLGTVTSQGISASLSAYGYTRERIPRFMDVTLADGLDMSGAVRNDAIDIFPLSLSFAKPLGDASFRHAIGLAVVLPDYDQFDGALDVPPSQLSFELRARRVAESKTYWLLAGWGGCYEAFCFGAAPTAAFLIDDGYDVTTVYLAADETTVAEASTSNKLLRMAFAIGAQFGAQFEPTMGLRLGFVVRTPMRSIWTDGEFLHVSTFVSQPASEAQSYVDRVESQDPRLDFRLPWRFAVGAAYSVPNAWAIALDLRLTLGQSEYAAVAGPNGEASMQPATPNGSITDVNRAINVAQYVRLVPAANMNVGGRVYLSETLVLQGGLFTDLSATSKNDVIRLDQERLSRVGATLGAAWFGESTRTWVTVLGALGSGSAPGFGLATDGSGFIATLTHLDSKTIMLLIGSSATL